MRVEAAFHFLWQMFSAPNQNSSPDVIVYVYIHKFNLTVSDFLSVSCGAATPATFLPQECLFSHLKVIVVKSELKWRHLPLIIICSALFKYE